MSDIVDELRQKAGGHRRLRMLAADEIERLRRDLVVGARARQNDADSLHYDIDSLPTYDEYSALGEVQPILLALLRRAFDLENEVADLTRRKQ